jgi:hypothetical protein
LDRHNTLLTELDLDNSFYLIATDWTDTPDPVLQQQSERAKLDPEAVHWRTVAQDPDEEDPKLKSYKQVYVSKHSWEHGAIDDFLRAVANDKLSGVIVAPESLDWLYCLYDGGVDIILASSKDRDELKQRHLELLPTRTDGL